MARGCCDYCVITCTMNGEQHKILTSSENLLLHSSRRHALAAVAVILLISQVDNVCGFSNPLHFGPHSVSRTWTTSLRDVTKERHPEHDSLAGSPSVLLNWNAANSSLGSLLLQLQKEEEEEMRRAVGHTNSTSSTLEPKKKKKQPPPPPQHELSPMDLETARELDDAISKGSKRDLLKGIQILPPSSLHSTLTRKKELMGPPKTDRLFRTAKKQEEFEPEVLNMPLSMPEHYNERIGRDMRHLAVSIASNVDEVWQWRLFCAENGGIVPLLKCVQDGAKSIHARSSEDGNFDSQLEQFAADQDEETFMAACTACRAFRDLCALSPEVAAIITDGILRAEKGWGSSGPMTDFITLLNHANEMELKREARDILRHNRRNRRETRRRCKLYVLQLLLAMAVASDNAIHVLRSTKGLTDAVLASSSYARIEQTRRWIRYPGKLIQRWTRHKVSDDVDTAGTSRPFIEAAAVRHDLRGQVQATANQLLAAIGYNVWCPKIPGQKGLRILCMDGGGTRGMAAVTTLRRLVEGMGGIEVCETFDMIAGTSTGAIIAFLVGLRKETSGQAKERYDALIKKIFVKSALSTPMMLLTTASYDETPFMDILSGILGDNTMLDSRADPTVPLVFAVTSKMSSKPTHVALFRNYNYASGELPDSFIVDPEQARAGLGLPLELEEELAKFTPARRGGYEDKKFITGTKLSRDASRYPGSFRVLQRHALRASTAAPTMFKPVVMGGEVYCDGGIVASNPTAVAIHEARTLFPDIPIEMVVSIGTGGFTEEKSAPRIGWDGIIAQIVDSACDGEQIHHILEDVLGGEMTSAWAPGTKYYRLNPVVGAPNDFPIDGTDPALLAKLSQITSDYMAEPEQKRKLQEIRDTLDGRRGWRKILLRA